MEIEKLVVSGVLPMTSGQDAGMQPTLPSIRKFGWQTLLLLLCSSFLASCLSNIPDINKLRTFAEDRREAPFPPTQDELSMEEPFVAVLPPKTQPGVTSYANDNSVTFVKSMMEDAGNLQVFPDERLQQIYNSDEYRMLDLTRQEDAVKLGEALRVKYLVMMETAPPNFKHEAEDWSAVVTVRLYQLFPTLQLVEETFPYQQSELEEMRLDLRPKLQAALPLRAFLVETFERRKVARLNIGVAQGAEELDRFLVYRRDKRTEVAGRFTTRSEEYNKQVGTLEIFRTKENESWAMLEPIKGQEILPGDAAFKIVRYKRGFFRKVDLGRFD
jgi:hypothetical protein